MKKQIKIPLAILRKIKNMAKKRVFASSENQQEFNGELLESMFRTSKKTIQEYVWEIERHCRYKSVETQVADGVVLDDRSRLIDLYEACVQQDAHLRSVIETLMSQILGERYILARINDKGKPVKDVEETKKIQGSKFITIIKGIAEARLYGYTAFEILPKKDPYAGDTYEINTIERRNVLANQMRIVKRQGQWNPGWDLYSEQYRDNYVLVNSGDLGLFSATTPSILAKKFTMANYVNFSHTYGQPIIHGRTASEQTSDRQRLADQIASAAQNKVIVTGLEDEVDIKTFTMSNSEKIYTGLISMVNKEVSNIIVGSESMAGATQSYVGSTNAHEDVFRDRIEMFREYIKNIVNEQILPRLVKLGYLEPGTIFMYANKLEMSNKDKINLYNVLATHFEIPKDEIEKEFGIVVGQQINLASASGISGGDGDGVHRRLSDEEYYRRYGHSRDIKNFL